MKEKHITTKIDNRLAVLDILQKKTDDDTFLTQEQVRELVRKIYDVDLNIKTIRAAIAKLKANGYPIIHNNNGRGVAIKKNSILSRPETTFIVDTVFSSRCISEDEAKLLTDHLLNAYGSHLKRNYKYIMHIPSVNRTANKNTFEQIDTIRKAIVKYHKIKFHYLSYDNDLNETFGNNGNYHIVSPFYLAVSNGRIYLLCGEEKDERKTLCTYRIDFIRNLKLLKDQAADSIKEINPNFTNIGEYLNEHIYLFNKPSIRVKLKLSSPYVIRYIKDWFGQKTEIWKEKNDIFAKIKCDEDAIFYWCMQYSELITVLYPDYFVKRLKDAARKILNY